MEIQRVYVIRCHGCDDPIVLPRQSPIERFGGLSRLATDIWPLRYWCEYCGTVSSYQAEDSRLEAVEVLAQNPYTETLWGIDFQCVLEDSERHFSIYTKRLAIPLEDGAIQRVIYLSGICEGASGPPKILKTYAFRVN